MLHCVLAVWYTVYILHGLLCTVHMVHFRQYVWVIVHSEYGNNLYILYDKQCAVCVVHCVQCVWCAVSTMYGILRTH